MRICYLTAGPVEWASSRMRAYWPAAEMDDAIVVPIREVERDLQATGEIPDADVYVFQKLYSGSIRAAMPPGAKVVWDVCDPLWWFDPEGSREALRGVDAVTASTWALADDLRGWGGDDAPPVTAIGDCIDPSHFPIQAQHSDRSPIRFIWYGIYTNRVALHAAQAYLERLVADRRRIQLTIMDERPDIAHVFPTRVSFPIHFTEWSLERENEVIAAHDIALLPDYPGPWGRMKSPNKRLTALACGVPTTDAQDYNALVRLVWFGASRRADAKEGAALLDGVTPAAIAPQWTRLFEELAR